MPKKDKITDQFDTKPPKEGGGDALAPPPKGGGGGRQGRGRQGPRRGGPWAPGSDRWRMIRQAWRLWNSPLGQMFFGGFGLGGPARASAGNVSVDVEAPEPLELGERTPGAGAFPGTPEATQSPTGGVPGTPGGDVLGPQFFEGAPQAQAQQELSDAEAQALAQSSGEGTFFDYVGPEPGVTPTAAVPASAPPGMPPDQWNLAVQAGQAHGVDPVLLAAIAKHETGFGTQGLGRRGLHLGVGAFDAGPTDKWAGAETQYSKAAELLASWGANTVDDVLAGEAAPYATDPGWEQKVAAHYQELAGGIADQFAEGDFFDYIDEKLADEDISEEDLTAIEESLDRMGEATRKGLEVTDEDEEEEDEEESPRPRPSVPAPSRPS